MRTHVARSLALCLLVASSAHAVDRIYAEYPIAGATVGYTDSNQPVERVITVALVASDNERELDKFKRGCLSVRVRDVASFIRKEVVEGAAGSAWRTPTTVLTDLASRLEPRGEKVAYTAFQKARAGRAADLQRALLRQTHSLAEAFKQCGLPTLQASAKPTLILRECPAPTLECEQLQADAHLSPSVRPTSAAVDAMALMLHAHGTLPLNQPLTFGTFADADKLVNQFNSTSSPDAVALTLAPFVALKDVYAEIKWPTPPDNVTAVKQFETLVEDLRARPEAEDARLATAVPLILGLSKTQLLQVQDIASEAVVMMDMLPDATKVPFTKISDELGRARVIECARLRGASTAEQVTSCAGYQISEDALLKCLSGAPCRPPILDKAYATILDIDRRLSRDILTAHPSKQIEALLKQADLPRLLTPQPLAAMRKTAQDCANAGHATESEIARCMALGSISPENRQVVECLSAPERLGRHDKLINDCLDNLMPPALRAQYQCVSSPNVTPRELAECAGVPEKSLALLDAATCASKAPSTAAAAECYAEIATEVLGGDAARYGACVNDPRPMEVCLTDVLVSNVGLGPEAARIADCARKHTPENVDATTACILAGAAPNSDLGRVAATVGPCLASPPTTDASRAVAICAAKGLIGEFGGQTAKAVAACAAGGVSAGSAQCAANALAQDIKDPLARCIVQGGASVMSMQTCALAQQLDGSGVGDRLMLCALNNGGASAPAAACALGIDPNKREIAAALQCASNSPDPNSFAVCATGQIVMMTVSDCLENSFGDGKCFGPNNELQRALRAVGIDLSSSSVPARYIDAHMEIYRQQIYLGKSAIAGLKQGAQQLGEALRDFGDTLASFGRSLGGAGKNLVEKGKDIVKKFDPRNW